MANPPRSTYQVGRTDAIAALVRRMRENCDDPALIRYILVAAHSAGLITDSDMDFIWRHKETTE